MDTMFLDVTKEVREASSHLCKLKKHEYIVLDLCLGRDMHMTIVGMYHPPQHILMLWRTLQSSGHCMPPLNQ